MIFTKNNPAIEGYDCQYVSEKKKIKEKNEKKKKYRMTLVEKNYNFVSQLRAKHHKETTLGHSFSFDTYYFYPYQIQVTPSFNPFCYLKFRNWDNPYFEPYPFHLNLHFHTQIWGSFARTY